MPSPASLGFYPATSMLPSVPLAAQAESGLDPTPEWAPGPTRASPGGDEAMPSPESLGFGQATPMPLGAPSVVNRGRTPPEWAPSPTLASLG